MRPNLLLAIHTLGDQMYDALQSDDLETFFSAMEQRTGLIEELAATRQNPFPDEALVQMAPMLAEQQQRLTEAFAAQEQRLREAIGEQMRLRTAHRKYHQRTPRRSLLNKNLHG